MFPGNALCRLVYMVRKKIQLHDDTTRHNEEIRTNNLAPLLSAERSSIVLLGHRR